MIDENGKLVKEVFNQYQGTADQEGLCRNFIEYQYENGFFGYISNKLIRRKLLEKSKTVFPSDESLLKMLYLAMMDITKKWTRRRQDWGQIHSQLEIFFEERLSGL